MFIGCPIWCFLFCHNCVCSWWHVQCAYLGVVQYISAFSNIQWTGAEAWRRDVAHFSTTENIRSYFLSLPLYFFFSLPILHRAWMHPVMIECLSRMCFIRGDAKWVIADVHFLSLAYSTCTVDYIYIAKTIFTHSGWELANVMLYTKMNARAFQFTCLPEIENQRKREEKLEISFHVAYEMRMIYVIV